MCGILAILGAAEALEATRATALKLARRLRHRGPDCERASARARARG
jgi:asparagine synthetase B (glutamine-hydrolysing)